VPRIYQCIGVVTLIQFSQVGYILLILLQN
jgi:hypothetical protein